jgi:hypothetical protein
MDNNTIKNIFKFLEDEGEHRAPFMWKWKNNIPLTEEDLNVESDLNFYKLEIKSLPKGLKIHGHLGLYKTNITSLPKGLEVGGDLNLNETKIKSLPKGLKVGGNLYLTYCGKLTSLPEGLKVGGDLYIHATPLTKYLYDDLRQMVKPGFIKGIIYR